MVSDNPSISRKFIVKIPASKLGELLQYEKSTDRDNRNHPYKITPTSTLKIHNVIQRGLTMDGRCLQEEKKVKEIKDILLGKPHQMAYLGSLVWNVRDLGTNAIQPGMILRDGRPPEHQLDIESNSIYITDSAHRHFGIVEALKAYNANPAGYPRFSQNTEFLLEIYNLPEESEKALFNELNSKQKKITASARLRVDNRSPIGMLKDKILEYDFGQKKLFYNNIESNSNLNHTHTLMTMSVFVQTIKEMFNEIPAIDGDEQVREDLAKYYCEYFYLLNENITARISFNGHLTDVNPIQNLYTGIIEPIELRDATPEELETPLEQARTKATARNQTIRKRDILTSNTILRALAYVGKSIRYFENPSEVIERLQANLQVPLDGMFFQEQNSELFLPMFGARVPIATSNADGSLNVQVQTETLKAAKIYLENKLCLIRKNVLSVERQIAENINYVELDPNITLYTFIVHPGIDNFLNLQYRFYLPNKLTIDSSSIKIGTSPRTVEWPQVRNAGRERIPCTELIQDEHYEDEYYSESILGYIAKFSIPIPYPPADVREMTPVIQLDLIVEVPGFPGELSRDPFIISIQPE